MLYQKKSARNVRTFPIHVLTQLSEKEKENLPSSSPSSYLFHIHRPAGAFEPGKPATHRGQIKYPECRKTVMPPTHWDPATAERSAAAPDMELRLEFVHGCVERISLPRSLPRSLPPSVPPSLPPSLSFSSFLSSLIVIAHGSLRYTYRRIRQSHDRNTHDNTLIKMCPDSLSLQPPTPPNSIPIPSPYHPWHIST